MRRHDHHPVFDAIVYGTALVLAVVLAYFSWQRFGPSRGGAAASQGAAAEEFQPAPEVEHVVKPEGNLQMSGTVRAVAFIPPSQGSLGAPHAKKRKKVFVP